MQQWKGKKSEEDKVRVESGQTDKSERELKRETSNGGKWGKKILKS